MQSPRIALPQAPSLRAERSNPESFRSDSLDCFVARAPRNDGLRGLRLTSSPLTAAQCSRRATFAFSRGQQ
ncbi:hypothetical protein GPL20_20390 [Bradyrhizobium cajani]|uniref:Uncharacterized protein n=1 Tax=Bradyrhizobium cajani TaxID=1928661 RepID=A0A844TAS9_9BRAD|nr:hypothetical protein [Bradyrhizobium cajani]